MSLNPLNELKRRLSDELTPLPKRLRLAQNVIKSHHFPTAPKERIIADWLNTLINAGDSKEQVADSLRCVSMDVLMHTVSWLNRIEDMTGELKGQVIQIVAQYLKENSLSDQNFPIITAFIQNDKIFTQLTLQTENYLFITVTLLKYMKHAETDASSACRDILNNMVRYYRECKKKLEFILLLLDGENIEAVFSHLNTECHDAAINVCQNILFPTNKKSFFVVFLQTLIRKESIDELIAEKGDNIQSVLKIMSTFFTFPKGRTDKNPQFLIDFIQVFVSCFRNVSMLVFAFYIMVANSLKMEQSYLTPAMTMPPITFSENDSKIKSKIFLKMLEFLLQYDIDINIRLTDTFGEKISKVEIKKNFASFLQAVMLGQLKLEGKINKNTIVIVKTALILDPELIEQKLDKILPPLMTVKKNNSNIIQSYTEMLNCLLEVLFKLSRGTLFTSQILPNLKINLEAVNTEQFELTQRIKECEESGNDCVELKNKVIGGFDIFPEECIKTYGKLTSELMFRQNKDLLTSLQKDFEINCLMMLEEGFVSPSIITLTEVLSAILSSFLRHNKMADHTVPKPIAEEFWPSFQSFERECLAKFGQCVLKLSYNPQLCLSFLKLCEGFTQLKLLNIKYSNTKIEFSANVSSEMFDLSDVLPCLTAEQWVSLAPKITEDEAVLVLNNLQILQSMAHSLTSEKNTEIMKTKPHLVEQVCENPNLLTINNYFATVLLKDLDKTDLKSIAKSLVAISLSDPTSNLIQNYAIINNKVLMNQIVLETSRNYMKCFENCDSFNKALKKKDIDLIVVLKEAGTKEFLNNISVKEDCNDTITNCLEILRKLPVCYLEESYQLLAVFIALITKKCCHKKLRKISDNFLLSLYEMCPKYPDLYKIFSVQFLFEFEDRLMLDLLTLKMKTANNLLVVKSLLESGVKKVKTDPEVVKKIVEILLSKKLRKGQDTTSIEYFANPVFQLSCLILPIIAKEKKAITTGPIRSILANLQEKLHKFMLESFENIKFDGNSSLIINESGNTDESMVVSESTVAILNAMGAYSLTLSKYCETTDAQEIQNLQSLWSGLDFFMQNAIKSIEDPSSKTQHVEASIHLLNVILRHINKLATHEVFKEKEKLYVQIWKSVVARLLAFYQKDGKRTLQDERSLDLNVTLKFLCELASVETFVEKFVKELESLCELQTQEELRKKDCQVFNTHKVAKYIWSNILKSNIDGQKSAALAKLALKITKNLRMWIYQNYEVNANSRQGKKIENPVNGEEFTKIVTLSPEEDICEWIRVDLDIIAEIVLAAKKISLDYKCLDAIFTLQHMVYYIMGVNTVAISVEIGWQSYFKLSEGAISVLNNLLMSREEILEDRWPCYMQCYRAIVTCLCQRSSSKNDMEKHIEERLAQIAISVEELTQSMCKRKTHVSRIAAYAVADICSLLELHAPSKLVRQHLENSVALLIQVSDTSHAMAFLRRALVGSPGQMTMTNMYTMYKRYHKYTGNA